MLQKKYNGLIYGLSNLPSMFFYKGVLIGLISVVGLISIVLWCSHLLHPSLLTYQILFT